jgi:hypothetical protein
MMKKQIRILVYCLIFSGSLNAQKNDTVRKYLDGNFALCNRARAAYSALAVKDDDHWILYATYPDTSVLLTVWFKDRDLTIKDGPYTFFFGKGRKAMQGSYVNNQQQGGWKFWYPNGILRDSGVIENGQMGGTWISQKTRRWLSANTARSTGTIGSNENTQIHGARLMN